MNVYLSDQEKVDLIKNWWKNYGGYVILFVVFFVGSNFFWRYWHSYKEGVSERASIVYSQMLAASSTNQDSELQLYATHLQNDYKDTPYATLAKFFLARQEVNGSNLSAAEEHLNWILKHGSNNSFKQIARLRLARILIAAKESDRALALLNKIDDSAFLAAIDELKGDIFLGKGDKLGAVEAYQSALNNMTLSDAHAPLLKMKLEQFTTVP